MIATDAGRIVRFEALRAELAQRYPAASAPDAGRLATGCAAIDGAGGGLRRGAVSEFCGSTGNGALFLAVLLGAAMRERCRLALIDGGGGFEPADWDADALRRMLWVICPDAKRAIQAADLLLRDGNVPVLALDLQLLPADQLRRIPASTWHRFQRVAGQSGVVFVALTPRPMVEGARARIVAGGRWTLDAMRMPRRDLPGGMRVNVFEKSTLPAPRESTRRTA